MRHKLSLIYLLNVTDWICTVILLRTGDFYEANPLMSPIIGSIAAGILVKCILPAALLFLIYRMCIALGAENFPLIDRFIAFVTVLYTALCAIHIADFLILHLGA